MQRRRAHHRPHRAAPGAPARAGRPAHDAGTRPSSWRRRCQAPAALLAQIAAQLGAAGRLRRAAGQRAIQDEPAALVRDGGVIATGFDAELDELRAIQDQLRRLPAGPGSRARRARTGIANLRVQFNKVHGFYIEVTQGQLDKVPDDYRRRQTLKNAERFITPELKAFEDKALSAQDRALAREKWLYEQLLDQLQAHRARADPAGARAGDAGRAVRAGRALAHAELVRAAVRAASPASRSRRAAIRWCEAPAGRDISPAPSSPTTRAWARKQRMQVITGPNMGGKSTYMRQVALIVLLASIGSYVPAAACRLGPIDAIHTRIGAADDLANAQSTFMLEMTEAAQILHGATPQSLVLMDEIGRGTSHLRRPGAGRRHRHPAARQDPGLHAVRHALLRADRVPGHAPRRRQRARERHRVGPRHRVPARDPARPGQPAATASRWRGWPACPRPWSTTRARRWRRWNRSRRAARAQVDLFAPPPAAEAPAASAVESALAALDPDA